MGLVDGLPGHAQISARASAAAAPDKASRGNAGAEDCAHPQAGAAAA